MFENFEIIEADSLLEGKYDDYPEQAFMFVGTIEEVKEKAERLGK